MEEQNKININPVDEIISTPPSTALPRRNNNSTNSTQWNELFSNLPTNLPSSPNFEPRLPLNYRRIRYNDPCRLTRRIYLNMLNAIDYYTRLLTIAPSADLSTIRSLRSQMQILSVAILSYGQDLQYCSLIPQFQGSSNLSNNYVLALNRVYRRVFTIYEQTLQLYFLTQSSNNSTTLLIIINNLKNQLFEIDNLIVANQEP